MHPHLIDWYRTILINPDPKLVEQRSDAAQKYADKMSAEAVPKLLRMFLFAKTEAAAAKEFTDELLNVDKEFPVANNTGEIRLMSGVVMLTTFSSGSRIANAFALGLRAAAFPSTRIKPAQSGILLEAETYLRNEADEQRPDDFDAEPQIVEDILGKKLKAMREAEKSNDAAQIQTAQTDYTKAVAKAIKESHRALARRVRRLAEESALLWWLLGEYSACLKLPVSSVSAADYALAAAAEAADRTHILPPPPSIGALLARSLKPCKDRGRKKLNIAQYVAGKNGDWRAEYLKKLEFANCVDLVPLTTVISKCQEFGDAEGAMKVIPNICPGVNSKLELLPTEAAQQFYAELMFLKALVAARGA